jgi:ABC-type multidrug transport system permease subunit
MIGKKTGFNWVAIGIAAAAVTAVAVVIARFWSSIGTSEISFAGWLAMALGIVATLALGIGLMSLVFISSRRGYDEGPRRDR